MHNSMRKAWCRLSLFLPCLLRLLQMAIANTLCLRSSLRRNTISILAQMPLLAREGGSLGCAVLATFPRRASVPSVLNSGLLGYYVVKGLSTRRARS
jgi:hypothetical protein